MVERDCETEIFPVCLEKESESIPFSPIASGFLSGKVTAQEQFGFDDVRKFVPQLSKENIEANQPILDLLYRFAVEKNATNAQISLAWMLHKYPNVVPIPGSKNQERILENLGLGTSRFPMMSSGSYNQHWMNVRYTDIVGVWKRNRRVSVNNGVKKQISESSHIQSGTE